MNARAAATQIRPCLDVSGPTSLGVTVSASFRPAMRPSANDTLEATIGRSIEDAFRQFGRELAG